MKFIINILIYSLFFNGAQAQTSYYDKYIYTLENSNFDNNVKSIKSFSIDGNVLKFMELGYFINGNNILSNYKINNVVINNIISSGNKSKNSGYKWIVTQVSKSSLNYLQKGREFILYEGYLFRYIAQFQYLNPNNLLTDKDFVRENFFKWYNKSVRENGDASTLYGIRLHMGSHWATVAAYLTKLDPKNRRIYQEFLDIFNQQLRKSLKIRSIGNKECYVWNSTYPDQFTQILKKRNKEEEIQDVSHGNHIIQYVVDSYNLGVGGWNKSDLEKFSNTLKYIIWRNKDKSTDNVDGSSTNSASLVGMGWKQSDGWMKLMVILRDKELFKIYDDFYKKNSIKVSRFYPNLQYFALMALYIKKVNDSSYY